MQSDNSRPGGPFDGLPEDRAGDQDQDRDTGAPVPDLLVEMDEAFGRQKVKRRRSKRWAALAAFAILFLVGGVMYAMRAAPVMAVVHALEKWKGSQDLGRVVEHKALILRGAKEAGVDPYLLAGVMWSESRGRSGQTSSAGAMGLMQLSHAAGGDAAMRLGVAKPTKEQLLHDDGLNVRLAANHVRWLLDHRGDWSLQAVLVSYNAGRAKLKRWIEEKGSYEAWCESERVAEAEGRKSTGALRYAERSLRVAEELRVLKAIE